MPADVHIEDKSGGVLTIWISEHNPLSRLKLSRTVVRPACRPVMSTIGNGDRDQRR